MPDDDDDVAVDGGGPRAAPYLVQLALSWDNFRVSELRAAADAAGVALRVDDADETALLSRTDGVLLPIHLANEESARRLASRAVLVKSIIEPWASGASWDELTLKLRAYPAKHAAPYIAEGSTFRVNVISLGRRHTDEERMDYIKQLEHCLDWRGKVRLKDPDHTFVVVVDTPVAQAGQQGQSTPAHYYFGRHIADGRRELVNKYDLKRRNYIGTTSLDAELSLLMANLARVRPGHLVYDPYCGTAGTLIAAAAFGAHVLGCDLHAPALRGELRTRSGPSKRAQAVVQGIPETFCEYGLHTLLGRIHGDSGAHLAFLRPAVAGLFDAIITDPPYGIRERPSEVADERLLSRTLAADHLKDHIPRTAVAPIEQILTDLFQLAAGSLVPGGRLVFLLPTTTPFHEQLLPPHPGLALEEANEQLMAARWSRWCITMRREASVTAGGKTEHFTPLRCWRAKVVGAGACPTPTKTAPIFSRANLRPDDAANADSQHALASAAGDVLHPHLLGKSAGSRRRIEKRLARVMASEAQAKPTSVSGQVDHSASNSTGSGGDSVGYGALCGSSARAKRRQVRNSGRGEYEQLVREKLGSLTHTARVDGWLGTFNRIMLTYRGWARATTVTLLGLASIAVIGKLRLRGSQRLRW